jgi:hypothetical protein
MLITYQKRHEMANSKKTPVEKENSGVIKGLPIEKL